MNNRTEDSNMEKTKGEINTNNLSENKNNDNQNDEDYLQKNNIEYNKDKVNEVNFDSKLAEESTNNELTQTGNKKETNKVIKEIISWIKLVIIAVAIAWGINHFVLINATIPSESMEDTIMVGDRVYAFRLAYLLQEPKRGDVVIFPFPDNEKENYIKRIIGLPGDTVEGIDGVVYVNGKPLKESYTKDQIQQDFGPVEVPKESYFMMGDHRSVSADSRYWTHPFVKKDKILGKAFIKYYPHIKFIK